MALGDLLNLPQVQFPRQPILPDSMLPAALQRNPTLSSRSLLYTPNQYDQQISDDSNVWLWVAQHGGLKSCCWIPELGAPIWSVSPFLAMPSNGLRFQYVFQLPIGSIPFTGTDTLLGSFQVDSGFDGSLTAFNPVFTGTGFTQGSGSIVWRLEIGQRFAKTLGNVITAFTDFDTASSLSVPGSSWKMVSGQTVQVFANIPALSPVTGGQVMAVVNGWTFPRR